MLRSTQVLKLWRASEMLSMPELDEDIEYFHCRSPLPWQTEASSPKDGHIRLYKVYLGEVKKAVAHARMASAFGASPAPEEFEGQSEFDADCYSAVLLLDENGRLLEPGYQIADYVLGYRQALSGDMKTSELRKVVNTEFEKRNVTRPEGDPVMICDPKVSGSGTIRVDPASLELMMPASDGAADAQDGSRTADSPIDWDCIEREERYLRHFAPMLFEAWEGRVRIEKKDVKPCQMNSEKWTISASPFLADIETLITASENRGSLGTLGETFRDPGERTDLLRDADALRELLALTKLPAARWPSNPEHHLAMGQQAAVASICELIPTHGLRAVNGPPGTGKTTLLRDVIAEIVTQRAFAMLRFANSADLFETLETGGRNSVTFYVPINTLGDTGIVVASSNNSAVENISVELPRKDAIDSSFAEASYLPCSGTALLQTADGQKAATAWGSIAARLGNNLNRKAFAAAWHPKSSGSSDPIPPLALDLTDSEGQLSFEQAKEQLINLRRQLFNRMGELQAVVDRRAVDKAGDIRFPTDAHLSAPESERQRMSFHVDPEIEKLRARIFLSALELHRVVLAENYGRIRPALEIVNDLAGGSSTSVYIPPRYHCRFWDLLFLCCPVVSTSLASIGRMFEHLTAGQIPWLLIDEAGQATPAAVAGALWRAKRAVIVGDPRQIEPVATFAEHTVRLIADALEVPKAWHPNGLSAQAIADNAMKVGAYIGAEGDERAVWGGLPLRSHRRCADPMFSIANDIAYAGQMVQGGKSEVDSPFPLGKSCWINVPDKFDRDKAKPAETEFVNEVWNALRDIEEDYSVFFISPFKDVIKALPDMKRHPRFSKGTVHTFQGKEADVVFIVLGTKSGSAGDRSRFWAGSTPNILNVALTRAKKRVYIVGSFEDWGSVPNFSVLAAQMKADGAVIDVGEARTRLPQTDLPRSEPKIEIDTPFPLQATKTETVTSTATIPSRLSCQPRSVKEIWREHNETAGFRIVRSSWEGKTGREQYHFISSVTSEAGVGVEVRSSYTAIEDGIEIRKDTKTLADHDKSEWITLEEWRAEKAQTH